MADELVAAMMPHLCAPQRDVRVRYTFIMVMAGLLRDVASAKDKRFILLHRQNDGQSRFVKRHEMVVMRLFLLLGLRRRRRLVSKDGKLRLRSGFCEVDVNRDVRVKEGLTRVVSAIRAMAPVAQSDALEGQQDRHYKRSGDELID